jgi:hypothetical protein
LKKRPCMPVQKELETLGHLLDLAPAMDLEVG